MPLPPRPILLTGIKHCGKSTLGRALSRRWKCPFLDTDELLETRLQRLTGKPTSCREFFREFGERRFREEEAAVIAGLAQSVTAGAPVLRVIALGGGVPGNVFVSPDVLRSLGVVVCIQIDDAVAFERVRRRGLPPFLVEEADPFGAFCRMNRERLPGYQRVADLFFYPLPEDDSATSAERLMARIMEFFEEKSRSL